MSSRRGGALAAAARADSGDPDEWDADDADAEITSKSKPADTEDVSKFMGAFEEDLVELVEELVELEDESEELEELDEVLETQLQKKQACFSHQSRELPVTTHSF